ncbi:hypothetical protein ABK040_007472 [Willaertia magna]
MQSNTSSLLQKVPIFKKEKVKVIILQFLSKYLEEQDTLQFTNKKSLIQLFYIFFLNNKETIKKTTLQQDEDLLSEEDVVNCFILFLDKISNQRYLYPIQNYFLKYLEESIDTFIEWNKASLI